MAGHATYPPYLLHVWDVEAWAISWERIGWNTAVSPTEDTKGNVSPLQDLQDEDKNGSSRALPATQRNAPDIDGGLQEIAEMPVEIVYEVSLRHLYQRYWANSTRSFNT